MIDEPLPEKIFLGDKVVREYIVSESGERTRVILDLAEYERLVEAAEELEDITAYDEAKAAIESGEDNPTPLREALPRIERKREELRRKGVV